jgi:sugar transferase (PEP-CTERM system associated)
MQRDLAFQKLGNAFIEFCLLTVCIWQSHRIPFAPYPSYSPIWQAELLGSAFIAFVYLLVLHFFDVFNSQSILSLREYFTKLLKGLLVASAVLCIIHIVMPNLTTGHRIFAVTLIVSCAFLIIWHSLLWASMGIRPSRSNVLVLGTGRLARDLVKEVLRRPELGMKVKGFVDDDPSLQGVSIVNPKVIGYCQDLPFLMTSHNMNRIVVALPDRRGKLPIKELLDFKTRGIDIEDATSFYERVTGKIALENLKPSWMIFNSGFHISKSQLMIKRIASIILSSLMLIAASPVIVLIMVLVRLDSKGPIFHKQERVGREGRTFLLWKFRSMIENAEQETGPVWSEVGDKRITRLGKILRRYRLDELPQLFNVLRGDMSLVGPRPERPHFVDELAESIPFYQLRHVVNPGVTGWAQVNYMYASSIEHTVEKLQYDLFYIKNMSLFLDFIILFETVKTVLMRRGS